MKNYALAAPPLATAGTKLWMGLDVGKKSMSATVLDPDARIVLRATLQYKWEDVAGLVGRFPGCGITAVYEAGQTGAKLLRWLRELGCDAFMTSPSLVPTTSGDRVKTNAKDSLKLATLLRGGQLKRICDLSDEEYADRQLVRSRQRAVQHRSAIITEIKSLLLFHGVDLEEEAPGLTKVQVNRLKLLKTGHPSLDLALKEELRRYEEADAAAKRIEKLVRELPAKKKYAEDVALLETVPGIGTLTALTLKTELQSVDRFADGEHLASYIGLTPSEFSTGDNVHRGRITKRGNSYCRNVLVEACWTLVRKDPQIQQLYEKIAAKRGKKRAIVAIARRLANIIYAMLRDRTEYGKPLAATRPKAA
jgi:transposase